MGSVKKALRPVTRVVDNIIPNEIKPALPYLAATFGAPYLAGTGLFSGISSLALRKGLAGALTNVGTQALLGKKINPISAAVSGLSIGGGQFLKGDPSFIGPKRGIAAVAEKVGTFLSPDEIGGMSTLGEIGKATTAPLTTGAIQATQDAAVEANNAYEEYLKEQEAAGNEDIQTRVDFISRYLANAGFDQEYIDTRLNELGYAANGGLMRTRVGYESGGSLYDKASDMNRLAMEIKLIDLGYGGFGGKDLEGMSDEEIMRLYKEATSKADGGRIGYKIGGSTMGNFLAKFGIGRPSEDVLDQMLKSRTDEIFNSMFDAEAGTGAYSMEQMQKARDMAEKQAMEELEEYMEKIGMSSMNPPEGSMSDDMIDQIMEPRKEGRFKKADGGIMNLKMGGMPAEMDLRGGGFVPIGAKEKADDVPARLSKNEFVMTADAVRAAGGGSVNKGAKRMYDLMNKLEARV
jgi:hypothetical protein